MPPQVIAIVPIAIGLLLGGIAIIEILDRWSLRRYGRRTGGVVAHHERDMRDGLHAVIRFDDTQGLTRHFIHNVSGVTGLPIGRPVPVLYDPENLSRVQLDMRMKVWQPIVMLIYGALSFLSVGVLILVLG
ncbi:DUF3592 domain-containing protein [Actinomadura sp. LOL_016]|uniref:DUF3592 domain-containing protein n=1 Tax=unclassified Actinomadura TaxID=2626254 RepID=UPI003A7F94C1